MKALAFILLLIMLVSCKNEKSTEDPSLTIENTDIPNHSNDTIKQLLKVTYPVDGQLIHSPLEISGEARGYWFFEATATVELLNGNRDQISQSYITAAGDWMTTDWVPFTGTMKFANPSTENGFLVLHKANASGLREHAMSDTIAVRFQ